MKNVLTAVVLLENIYFAISQFLVLIVVQLKYNIRANLLVCFYFYGRQTNLFYNTLYMIDFMQIVKKIFVLTYCLH